MTGGFFFSLISIPVIGRINLDQLYPFMTLFTAIIFYELGRRIDLRWISAKKYFFISILIMLALMFSIITFVLSQFGFDSNSARFVGSILITTSPTFILFTIKEFKAEGYLTENILHIVCLSNVLGLFLFSILLDLENYSHVFIFSSETIFQIVKISISAIIGTLMAYIINLCSNLFKIEENSQLIIITLFIVINFLLNMQFNLYPMMSLLSLGLFTNIKNHRVNLHKNDLGPISSFSYTMLFVFAGYHLTDIKISSDVFTIATVLLVIKVTFPLFFLTAISKMSTLSFKKNALLGTCLLPLSSVAILMILDINTTTSSLNEKLNSILLSFILMSELIGPLLLMLSLKFSGEAKD